MRLNYLKIFKERRYIRSYIYHLQIRSRAPLVVRCQIKR